MPLPKVLFGATSKELAGAGIYVLVYDNELMARGVQLLINLGAQPDGLAGIKNFSEPEMAKALAYEGKQLLEMHSVTMSSLGGQKTLVCAYKYKDDKTKTPWESRQYQVAFPKYALEIAIIWEESQTGAMLPVLDELLDSIKFAPALAGNREGV